MAEIVLFHHAIGLTEGIRHFAERLTGHTVHLPDLYDGQVFDDLDDGVSHADALGMDTIIERAQHAVADLPAEVVYVGFSLGTVPAQALAQTRAGARGAVLVAGGGPTRWFDGDWPAGVSLQLHLRADDPWYEGDVHDELIAAVPTAEVFLDGGTAHLYADDTLPDFDAAATQTLVDRILTFLG